MLIPAAQIQLNQPEANQNLQAAACQLCKESGEINYVLTVAD